MSYLDKVQGKRQLSKEFQKNVNLKMIQRHAKKHKISLYTAGETVLVKNHKAKTRRGKKVLNEVPTFEGLILIQDGNRYKMQYESDNGEHKTEWFSVSDISSLTRSEETDRKKELASETMETPALQEKEQLNSNEADESISSTVSISFHTFMVLSLAH